MPSHPSNRQLRAAVHSFLAVAVGCIYGAAGYEIYQRYHFTLAAAQSVNLGTARAHANHVAHVVRGAQLIQDRVVERLQERGLSDLSSPEGHEVLQRLVGRFPETGFIVVLDVTGSVVATSHFLQPPKVNNADREYFVRHSRGEELVIGEPIHSRTTGKEVFTVSRAIRDRKGGIQAIVVVAIERLYFEKLFRANGERTTTLLMRQDGTILSRSPQVPVGERLPSSAKIFASIQSGPSGNFESFSPIDGKERLFSYSRASEFPVYVLVSEVRSDVLAKWRADIYSIAPILLAASLALLGAGLLILRALGREEAARMRLEESHRFQASVLDSISAHIAILDPDGTILSTNQAWRDFAVENDFQGSSGMVGENYFEVCRRATSPDVQGVIAGISAVMMRAMSEFQLDYDCHSPTKRRWFTMKVTPLASQEGSVLVSHENVTRLKEAEELLRERAETDPLTGLANRRCFVEQAVREFALARRHKSALSLVMFDCDYFKKVNDTYGHETGDKVLVDVARIVRQCLRSTDLVGRIGGEEFAVLLPETSLENAVMVAEQMRRAVASARTDAPQGKISITISLGVAFFVPEMSELPELMRMADRALYAAKEKGRNRVESQI